MTTKETEVGKIHPEQRSFYGDPYDQSWLEQQLQSIGYEDLSLKTITTSTMDDARDFNRTGVAIAEFQSDGRGRSGKSWQAIPGRSGNVTFAEMFDESAGDPHPSDITPPQMFALASCVALQQVTQSDRIKIRWPSDLTVTGNNFEKLGGILIENHDYSRRKPYKKLFGLGFNVHYQDTNAVFPNTDYGAISLAEITDNPLRRQELIAAIAQTWASYRKDLPNLGQPDVLAKYQPLWQANAALFDQRVRITGLGKHNDESIEGIALQFFLGLGIMLQTDDGDVFEITQYDPQTKALVIPTYGSRTTT